MKGENPVTLDIKAKGDIGLQFQRGRITHQARVPIYG